MIYTGVPVVANPYPFKPVFTVTGEQAHIDFQTPAYPWRICLRQGPLSIFLQHWACDVIPAMRLANPSRGM